MVEPGAIAIRWPSESTGDGQTHSRNLPLSDDPPTLLQWYVRSGDPIHKGQDLLLIGQGQSLQPMISPVDGTLLVQWSEVGESMGAGQTIGWIRPDSPPSDPS